MNRLPSQLSADEEDALYSNSWFAALDAELQTALLRHAVVWRVPGRQVLGTQGSVPDVWFGVAAGAVKISACSAAGSEILLDLLEPGQWFGDAPLLAGLAQPYAAQTWVPSTLLLMRRSALSGILEAQATLAPALAQLNWSRSVRMMERACDHSEASTEERTRRSLHALGRRFGTVMADGIRIGLPMTQTDLAELAGASRQRVNEALGKLQRKGDIRRGRGYIDLLAA